ncbi:MAG: phosphoadenosine phosphosulfate reductase family protein [Alphaproteobacteria bacterium]|nr:phosphoadenosine phosphosulfate reductase family protein [Alphaproteobacteria bacterium]
MLIASDGIKQRQSLPLEAKIIMTKQRIKAWYDHWDGEVYCAFSGGKDSTVLRHIIHSMGLDIPMLFSNTGLEYPEIITFVKEQHAKHGDIITTRPKRTFRDVVINDGYPLVSKKVSMMVERLSKPTDKNAATMNLYLTGYKKDGTFSKGSKLPDKWKPLINAPFKVTQSCCDTLKKEPFKRYEKETKRKPIIGVMAEEGGFRSTLTKCNVFEGEKAQSRPMLFWTEKDVWEYIEANGVEYSKIYDMGETRTGCMFCAFGAHLEKGQNRFQRMARTHPKQWNYCINKLGMGKALDFIGVKYLPEKEQLEMFVDAA